MGLTDFCPRNHGVAEIIHEDWLPEFNVHNEDLPDLSDQQGISVVVVRLELKRIKGGEAPAFRIVSVNYGSLFLLVSRIDNENLFVGDKEEELVIENQAFDGFPDELLFFWLKSKLAE